MGVGLQHSNDCYEISVLLFKSCLTLDKVLERSQHQRDAIIVGRVLDPHFIPCYAVLNRGSFDTQCIIGPNRFYYDVN
jgi:hypothetical protein